MNKQKLIPVLGGLLALQLLLALVLTITNTNSRDYTSEKLIDLDRDMVDRIQIEDGKSTALLEKKEQQWYVAAQDFPANEDNITKLLEALAGFEKSWPVATSSDAAERFQVGEKNFELKVLLFTGDKPTVELFIAAAKVYRKVHLRLANENEIHLGDLNIYDFTASSDDWLDKTVLQRNVDDIARLKFSDWTLQRENDRLIIDQLKNNQQTNDQEAEAILKKVADLRIHAVLGKDDKPEYKQNKPLHTINLTLVDDQEIVYTISQDTDKDFYVLKSLDRPEYFKIPTYILNPIFETRREQLVEAKQKAAESDAKS